jgi:hypothetical protein
MVYISRMREIEQEVGRRLMWLSSGIRELAAHGQAAVDMGLEAGGRRRLDARRGAWECAWSEVGLLCNWFCFVEDWST